MKTLMVLAGAIAMGEAMPWQRLLGIGLAFSGITAYTYLTMQRPAPSKLVESTTTPRKT